MSGKIPQTKTDIVRKLSVLEYVVAFNNYCLYEPSREFNSNDAVSVQKEASRMLRHLNMGQYLALISFVTEKPNAGGHIELNDADDSLNVFIDISIDIKGNNPAVLCVMAHEICHKLLHIRHFRGATSDENEVYTDLAAIYSGFGRQILNGCHQEWTTVHTVPEGTQTVKHTNDIGYLEINNYAYAYILMNSLYGIPLNDWKIGLGENAKKAVHGIGVPPLDGKYFDEQIMFAKQEYGDLMRDINLIEYGLSSIKRRINTQLSKLDYSTDVRSSDGFTKPITAYSLILEPPMSQEAASLLSIRKELTKETDIHKLKTVFCPYCGKAVRITSPLEDERFITVKCQSCEKTYILGVSDKKISEKKGSTIISRLFKKR